MSLLWMPTTTILNARNNREEELTVATFANLTVRSLAAPAAVLPGATINIEDTTELRLG